MFEDEDLNDVEEKIKEWVCMWMRMREVDLVAWVPQTSESGTATVTDSAKLLSNLMIWATSQ
jgi:hypothetical protein